MKTCAGERYLGEFNFLSLIKGWHGKFGHLNVLELDHDSDCTGFGTHNRIVNYGDFSGRIDKVWEMRNPTEQEVIKYYKKEWGVKGRFKVIFTGENEDCINFKIIKKN